MLVMPDRGREYRVLGVDPGGFCLGAAILEINFETSTVEVIHADTVHTGNADVRYPVLHEVHGGRVPRHRMLEDEIACLLRTFEPNAVISESPFMRKFAKVFHALIECVYLLRFALRQFDEYIPLLAVDPPSVKMAVGGTGKSDKDAMKRLVCKVPNLTFAEGIDYDSLDEHSVDAIAIAYCHCAHLLGCAREVKPNENARRRKGRR